MTVRNEEIYENQDWQGVTLAALSALCRTFASRFGLPNEEYRISIPTEDLKNSNDHEMRLEFHDTGAFLDIVVSPESIESELDVRPKQ